MFFCRFARVEGAEVAALAGLRVRLARIQTILARFQFSNHCACPRSLVLHLRGAVILRAGINHDGHTPAIASSGSDLAPTSSVTASIIPATIMMGAESFMAQHST